MRRSGDWWGELKGLVRGLVGKLGDWSGDQGAGGEFRGFVGKLGCWQGGQELWGSQGIVGEVSGVGGVAV